MARYDSTRAFFRQMPNDLRARYFGRRGVFEDVDFAGLEETRPEALFAAWLELPEKDRNAQGAQAGRHSAERGHPAGLQQVAPRSPAPIARRSRTCPSSRVF